MDTNVTHPAGLKIFCQDCKSIIALDEKFYNMSNETLQKISESIQLTTKQVEHLQDLLIQIQLIDQKVSKKSTTSSHLSENENNSMKEIEKRSKLIGLKFEEFFDDIIRTTYTQEVPKINTQKKSQNKNTSKDDTLLLEKTKKTFTIHLFSLISQKIGKNFPLCEQCTSLFFKQTNNLIKNELREKKVYNTYLQNFDNNLTVDQDLIEKKNQEYELEINNILSEIDRLSDEELQTQQEIEQLQYPERKFHELQSKYSLDLQNFKLAELVYNENRESVLMKTNYAQKELEKLISTSVLNDVFHILPDGPFVTINNFRLGRLQSIPVEWEEINTAWGLTALLIVVLSKRFNYEFKNYTIIPHGSYSRIAKKKINKNPNFVGNLKIKNYLELYFNNDGFLKRFRIKRFNQAMIWVLECVQEIAEFIHQQNKDFKLMYKIKKDKINNISIKYNNSNLTTWNHALRCLLSNLKQFMFTSLNKEYQKITQKYNQN
ncbi:beclin-1 [Anaeramoeba flamelloides]|uniref:Beclin-1 n=1 Tax=Anaeramoeba flamelloides TaxID=1746091 RepID=A0ABQ8YU91_9EUKA|nr:beclin-1 [Anaeramoeba flamelloides]